MSTPDWLDRYRAGRREEVWHELRQLGQGVRDPALLPDAQAVCDEMARRARANIELLVGRLTEQGFLFHQNDDDQTPVTPFYPARADAADQAAWLQDRFGPVPLALLSWVRIVGDVWLVGTHPEWPETAAADPLVFEVHGYQHPGSSIRDYFDGDYEAWQEWGAEEPEAGVFVLPVSPDQLHKDNTSGGAPYGIQLPDATAEGVFVAHAPMPFVGYLNWVFSHGGFPWPTPTASNAQWSIKQSLAQGMLAL